MKALLAAALLCALAMPAAAQNAITQEGTTVKDAPVMLKGNNRARQGATVKGAPSGQIVTTGDAVVGGRCDYSAPTDDPLGYYYICFDAKNNAIRAGGTKLPAQNMTIEINGTRYTFPGDVTLVGSDAVVGSNVGLKTIPGATGKRIVRLGFSTPGDGGLANYNWSDTNCVAADDGAQVQPSVTGCWIADFSGLMPVPEVWGAAGDGIANDAAAFNAALTAVAVKGGNLYARNGSIYGISSTITVKSDTCFIGAGIDKSKIKLLVAGITPVINMESRTCLENITVDATPQVGSGVVIQLGTSAANHRSEVHRVYTYKGCIALDVNGSSHVVDGSYYYDMDASPNCGGIRLGHNTTGGATVGFKLSDTVTACDATLRSDFNILMEDAGGAFIGSGVDGVQCNYGTTIKPGPNQEVSYLFCEGAVLGDTNYFAGLLIDTASSTGRVRGNTFNGCWTGGSGTGQGVVIKNTGGGTIAGTAFRGHRAYGNYRDAIEIASPVSGTITDTTFDGLRVCNTQYGVNVALGVGTSATIQNSRIGKQCDGQNAGGTANLLYGIGLNLNVTLIATGNDLSYSGPESWTMISGVPVGNSVIANNRGNLDDASGPTYASGSTVTLNLVAPRIHLTGTTTVNTITPAWNGQTLCIISDNGVVNFGTSGNISAATATSGVAGMVCGHYDGFFSKWYLH